MLHWNITQIVALAQLSGRVALAAGLAVCLSFATAPVALAQDDAIAACVPIREPLRRLACYDTAAKRADPAAGLTAGQWKVNTATSLVSGWENVYLRLESEDEVPVDYGTPKKATLEVSCVDNVTSVLFRMGGNYMSGYGDFGALTLRIDTAPAQAIRARVTPDNQAIGLMNGVAAIPLLRQISEGQSLLVGANPVNNDESAVSAQFDVRGLAEAIQPLRASCNW